MIPTLTIASIRLGALLGGTVVIETVFAWPGIGMLVLEGIHTRDYPVVQGGVLMLSFSFILINLTVVFCINGWIPGSNWSKQSCPVRNVTPPRTKKSSFDDKGR